MMPATRYSSDMPTSEPLAEAQQPQRQREEDDEYPDNQRFHEPLQLETVGKLRVGA